MRALILILITGSTVAFAAPETWREWGEHFSTQQNCIYWVRHFTNLENARLKVERLRESGAHPIWIWAAKRKLRQVFLKQQWDAFGELVDEADRIYPDNQDDPEAPWFERPRWK